jgi:glycogen operon protein
MSDNDWTEGGWMRTIGMFLPGTSPEIRDSNGQPVEDHDFLVLLNSFHDPVPFRVPEDLNPRLWSVAVHTGKPELPIDTERPGPDGKVNLPGRAMLLMRRRRDATARGQK